MPRSKPELRRALRARRREIVAGRDRGRDGQALAEQGLAVIREREVEPGDWVALYEASPLEPPTEVLIDALRAHGIRVMVPVTLADLDLDWREAGAAVAHTLGRAAIGDASVILAPALAVDGRLNRLGQGGGCYDRALQRAAPGAPVIALLHPGEVTGEDLPVEPHDRRVDRVITADDPLRRPVE